MFNGTNLINSLTDLCKTIRNNQLIGCLCRLINISHLLLLSVKVVVTVTVNDLGILRWVRYNRWYLIILQTTGSEFNMPIS